MSSWLNFDRMLCPDDAKTTGHKTGRKLNLWLGTKHEKLKFTLPIISPGTAAVEWFLVKKIFRFSCRPYKA